MGWLLLAVGVASAVYTSALSWTAYALGGDESAAPAAGRRPRRRHRLGGELGLAAVVARGLHGPPAGRAARPAPPGPGLALVAGLRGRVLGLVGVVAIALTPGPLAFFPGIDNPLGVEAVGPVAEVLQPAVQLGMVALLVVAIASVVVRVRRAGGVERRQVGWVGYAVALTVLAIVVVPSGWGNLVVLLVPAGIAVAALRYRLYDLDLLVNRTIVAALLVAGAALLYVALVGWVGALVGTSEGAVPFIAAFAIATAFHPARVRLQRLVDRLLYGLRGDPYALIQAVDRSLREAAHAAGGARRRRRDRPLGPAAPRGQRPGPHARRLGGRGACRRGRSPGRVGAPGAARSAGGRAAGHPHPGT